MTDVTVDGDDALPVPSDEPAPTLYDLPLTESCGQRVLHPSRAQYAALLPVLHADGWHSVLDVTAVDYLTFDAPRPLPAGIDAERFEVVVNLINHSRRERLRLRIQVPEHDPVLASAFGLYPGTEAPEREVFDMFGIAFDGHPDMTRILMPEDWVGHPLRKDYDVGRIPVQFKGAPANRGVGA